MEQKLTPMQEILATNIYKQAALMNDRFPPNNEKPMLKIRDIIATLKESGEFSVLPSEQRRIDAIDIHAATFAVNETFSETHPETKHAVYFDEESAWIHVAQRARKSQYNYSTRYETPKLKPDGPL